MSGRNKESLYGAIRHALNAHNAEHGSNTPDVVLAEFLCDCLSIFDDAVEFRERLARKAPAAATPGQAAGEASETHRSIAREYINTRLVGYSPHDVEHLARLLAEQYNAGKAAGEREERERAHRERRSRETEGERLTRQSWEHALGKGESPLSESAGAKCSTPEKCARCNGTGAYGAVGMQVQCGICHGTGEEPHGELCRRCAGIGELSAGHYERGKTNPCPDCKGTGRSPELTPGGEGKR